METEGFFTKWKKMKQSLPSVKESYVFSRAYRKGKSVVLPAMVLYLLPRKKTSAFSYGITVSKKLGNSPERNRAKRLIREALRLIAKENPQILKTPASLIVVTRKPLYEKSSKMQTAKDELMRGLTELNVL